MPDDSNHSLAEPERETLEQKAATAARDAAEPLDRLQDRLIDTVTAGQQEAIDTIESAGNAMFDVLSRASAEITDFVAERIRQDLDTQQAFLRCRSIDEVRDVQLNFVRTALDQYGTEAAKLMRLGSEVATKSFERVHH